MFEITLDCLYSKSCSCCFNSSYLSCEKVMKIIEALEGKGCRLPLMKGEAELAEKLAAITRQVAFFFFFFVL